MPQTYYVKDRDTAFTTVRTKIWPAHDDATALVSAHLISEALLHTYIASKVGNPDAMRSANLRFHQALCVAKSLCSEREESEWLWDTLEQLNRIRNRLAHDIEVDDLAEKIEALYLTAGAHISVHWPGSNREERERNKLKYFLIILCGVLTGLTGKSSGTEEPAEKA